MDITMNKQFSPDDQLMEIAGHNVSYLLCGKDSHVWFNGKPLAELLKYKDPPKYIRHHVDLPNRKEYQELVEEYGASSIVASRTGQTIHPQTTYVDEGGLWMLMLSSSRKEAKEIRQWVTTTVLPAIRRTGTYSVRDDRRLMMADIVDGRPDLLVRRDGYVHGTRLCAAHGKSLVRFLNGEHKTDARRMAARLDLQEGFNPRTGRIEPWDESQPVPLVQGYGEAGVGDEERPAWVHPQLANMVMAWCLPSEQGPLTTTDARASSDDMRPQCASRVFVGGDGTPFELQVREDGYVNASRLFVNTAASVWGGLKKKQVREYLEAIAERAGVPPGTDEGGKRLKAWDGTGAKPLLHCTGLTEGNPDIWVARHAAVAVAGMLDERARATVVDILLDHAAPPPGRIALPGTKRRLGA